MRPAGRGARCQAFSGVVNRVGDRRRQDRLKQQAAAPVYVAGEIVRVGQIVDWSNRRHRRSTVAIATGSGCRSAGRRDERPTLSAVRRRADIRSSAHQVSA
jgi:hypothetical protein